MIGMSWLKNRKMLIKLYQTLLNISLLILSLILAFFLFRELYYIFNDFLLGNKNVHQIFGKVLIFFLYFGFISIIVQYFKENYHFPIRYLLYIGITATIRFIIVNNGESSHNFRLAVVILVLTINYIILPFGDMKNS
ncbi:phosphate-starvation-inducible PsiE family protein [Bacillus sp. AFS041924]|uniref:phosphate-starvation-inducible PsiE family protein n=1 Tax=Bacillus sp. AFS041924 TaxID=2033503 RepID=UPI000BFBB46F|nr:phosphate-starvation-inducible PsiE family protein [Bacillus sp. AFS041924]PGS49697.1 phosphate-starvation-inducible protein PsiE [Bacillus sp. AFS041924]